MSVAELRVKTNPSVHVLDTAGEILDSENWRVCDRAQRQAIIKLLQVSVDVMKARDDLVIAIEKRQRAQTTLDAQVVKR